MYYTEITYRIEPFSEEVAEIIIAALGGIGFDSFNTTEDSVKGYITSDDFSKKNVDELEIISVLSESYKITRAITEIENRDWNKIWEENFTPIIVEDRIMVRAGLHPNRPEIEYDIIIEPKMSFGTGHHATTALMLKSILSLKSELSGKRLLDMGCGTGILAIMASMAGAMEVIGIDIDEWAYSNAKENLEKNSIKNVTILIGDATLLAQEEPFDIILANINRNILLADMDAYIEVLNDNGKLIMSGFYTEDLTLIKDKAKQSGLKQVQFYEKEGWVAAIFNR